MFRQIESFKHGCNLFQGFPVVRWIRPEERFQRDVALYFAALSIPPARRLVGCWFCRRISGLEIHGHRQAVYGNVRLIQENRGLCETGLEVEQRFFDDWYKWGSLKFLLLVESCKIVRGALVPVMNAVFSYHHTHAFRSLLLECVIKHRFVMRCKP